MARQQFLQSWSERVFQRECIFHAAAERRVLLPALGAESCERSAIISPLSHICWILIGSPPIVISEEQLSDGSALSAALGDLQHLAKAEKQKICRI